jgi:PPOX class probable F420-dependent enzyme
MEDREIFLRQPHNGILATLRADGRPYTVPVGWLWDGDAFWLIGTPSRVWYGHLRRDPRVSLCIEAKTPISGHIGVDGIAFGLEPPEFDIWPIARQMATKYRADQGPGVVEALLAKWRTEPRLLVKIEPQVWRAIDMRVYRGKAADREYTASLSRPPSE